MGANPTQAQGVCLFFIGFVLIAVGMATNANIIAFVLGAVVIAASVMLFLKCKPWEHNEE
jgi:membrane-bound ClpP family serine protease